MSNWLLYIITCLIWGSTWLAIHFQIDLVSPIWSVAYRFTLAAVILLMIAICGKHRLRFPLKTHGLMALQGLTLFCISYILYYLATQHLVSGLVALLSASLLIFNIINSRLFLKSHINSEVLIGCIIGICGLIVIFLPQIIESMGTHQGESYSVAGAVLSLLAALSSSIGNIISKHMQNQKLPVLSSNLYGMAYGALFSFIIAIFSGESAAISFTPMYIGTLLYLSVFGSVIAFGCYIKLIGSIGPARVAYVSVVTPLLAMILSTYFESFHWDWNDVMGITLALTGNVLMLKQRK